MPGTQTLTQRVLAAQKALLGRQGFWVRNAEVTFCPGGSGGATPLETLRWGQALAFLSVGPLRGQGADPMFPRPSAYLRLSGTTPAQGKPQDLVFRSRAPTNRQPRRRSQLAPVIPVAWKRERMRIQPRLSPLQPRG